MAGKEPRGSECPASCTAHGRKCTRGYGHAYLRMPSHECPDGCLW